VYRPLVLLFALVDHIVRVMWSGLLVTDTEWPTALADWIRGNDETIIARSTNILNTFQEDLVPAQDLSEVVDVCGLLGELPSSASAILEVLSAVSH
jgi:hypothetical protein